MRSHLTTKCKQRAKSYVLGKTIYLTYSLVTRLAAGKATVFATSLEDRYVFLASGVYWAPHSSFRNWALAEVINCVRDGLVLFDHNSEQSFDTVPRRWKALVASAPNPKVTHRWAKEKYAATFFMKTWALDEIIGCG